MDNQSSWRAQFGKSWNVPAAISEQFIDQSWGNDIAATFVHVGCDDRRYNGEACFTLWVDAEKPEDREFPEWPRFRVSYDSDLTHYELDIFSTNDEAEAVAFFNSLLN